MQETFSTCVDVVASGDAVEIIDSGLQLQQNVGALLHSDGWDLGACGTNLHYVIILSAKILKRVGAEVLRLVVCLK